MRDVSIILLVAMASCVIGCEESPQNRLLAAVTRNDLAAVEHLLNRSDVNVNYRAPITGENALGTAAASSNPELIELLLSHGANPNIANNGGVTPLLSAAYHGNIGVVRRPIDSGAVVDSAESGFGYTALAWATQNGHLETVKLLLEAGANAHVKIKNGSTPIELAGRYKRNKILDLLRAKS